MSLSLIVLMGLPLALIGGILAVYCTSAVISIPSIIGFITLFGIATRNGILLVSKYRHLQEQGTPLHETVLHGSIDRLNPILMTALTSALALIPLIVNRDEPGNEIQSPMAIVVLGGLVSSTLLNIYAHRVSLVCTALGTPRGPQGCRDCPRGTSAGTAERSRSE